MDGTANSASMEAAKVLRESMPLTAAWMRQQRGRWKDNAFISDVVKRGIAGERNCFYAVENGHIVGTPFDWTERGSFIVSMSVFSGAKFLACYMAPDGKVEMAAQPAEGKPNGAH
jgi:hypothetical protein